MQTRYILLGFFLLALTISQATAHRSPAYRARRQVTASSCSFMQCAVSHGNCVLNGSSLIFCQSGQHCEGSMCVDNLPANSACNPNAIENQCDVGTCVNTGAGFTCQIFQEIMPGNPCTADSQCYYSSTADGSTSSASTCVNGFCFGRQVGETCLASHQCVVGSFCSSSGTCTALGNLNAACSSDNDCSSRFTCFNSKCSTRYTQSNGASCMTTENCQPGLYCKSGSCAKASNAGRTHTTCDINTNDCGADQKCSCNGYTTNGQTATCAAIKGTPSNMPAIEKNAYACLDQNSCGSDADNSTTVSCINSHCLEPYCTYVTRVMPELFTDYPSCLVSRMVGSKDYFNLLVACQPYVEKATSSASSVAAASLSWVLLVSISVFFFAF